MGSIYTCMHGWVILKAQKRKQTDVKAEKKEKKGVEETSEKCEELEGKGQVLL